MFVHAVARSYLRLDWPVERRVDLLGAEGVRNALDDLCVPWWNGRRIHTRAFDLRWVFYDEVGPYPERKAEEAP